MNDLQAGELQYLRLAHELALQARAQGEVPVGAVLVHQGQVIGRGYNRVIAEHDPSAHAEIVALRQAGQYLGNYRLQDCDLYVTLEPCAMCAGAIAHARLARVVYGVRDARAGAAGSVLNVLADSGISHQSPAICAQDAAGMDLPLAQQLQQLLPDFFQGKRREQAQRAWPLRPDALRTPEQRFAALPALGQARFSADLPSLAGLRMHYWDSCVGGDMDAADAAPTYLCLHDDQSWSQDFADFWLAKSDAYRLLIPDLPGFGRSDKWKKSAQYSAQWYAQLLQEWLEQVAASELAQGRLCLVLLCAASMASTVSGGVSAAQQHPLLPALYRVLPGLQTQPVMWLPRAASRPWGDAPYPDAGHKAALQAWRAISAAGTS